MLLELEFMHVRYPGIKIPSRVPGASSKWQLPHLGPSPRAAAALRETCISWHTHKRDKDSDLGVSKSQSVGLCSCACVQPGGKVDKHWNPRVQFAVQR